MRIHRRWLAWSERRDRSLQRSAAPYRIIYQQKIRPLFRYLYVVSGILSAIVLLIEFGFYYPDWWNTFLYRTAVSVIAFMVFYELLSLILTTEGYFRHIRRHKIELIVVFGILLQWSFHDRLLNLPFLNVLPADQVALVFLAVSQFFLLFNNLVHLIQKKQFSRIWSVHPASIFLFSFAIVILLGSGFLSLPRATTVDIAWIDLFFTAVSATCVTGLSTIDVGQDLTFMGQVILLGLIQIGGLGLMTLTAFFAYYLAGYTSVTSQVMMRDLLSEDSLGQVKTLVKEIAIFTFTLELIGAVLLYTFTPGDIFRSEWDRVFSAIFHSISAFSNAGFSLYPDSLISISNASISYLFVIMVLIIIGGLGFPVITELLHKLGRGRVRGRLSVFTRIVLAVNILLWMAGFTMYFFLEAMDRSVFDSSRLMDSLFFTITARTAGFNTVDTSMVGVPMTFFAFLLMWIGASPGSTGGGIKTSTVAVAGYHIVSQLRGKNRVEIGHRTVAEISVQRAFSTVVLSLFLIFIGIFILLLSEAADFVDTAFEVVSAFATVGLSRGLTAELSVVGKLTLCIVMLMGRVGVFTTLLAFLPESRSASYKYPNEYIIVG